MNTQPPRASRVQFSLRFVLVVLTLVAIGGWRWQKRFRVESITRQPQASGRGVQYVALKRTESLRRQGLRRVVLDGTTTVVNDHGVLISEEEWRQGVRHGIHRRWNNGGELLFECEFKRGRLVRVGDTPVADFLHAASIADEPIGQRILLALNAETALGYLDQPLKDVIDDMAFMQNIPIRIDSRALTESGFDDTTPITSEIHGVPLFVALVELLGPLDLSCVYRHETLWVTTRESDLHQDDRAAQVRTDNASQELLRVLSEPATFDFLNHPLGAVLEDQGFKYGFSIDYDLRDDAEPVTLRLRTSTLRSALGALLHLHDLRCEAIGDKLVVTDAEGKTPRPRTSVAAGPTIVTPSPDPFGKSTGPFSKEAPHEDPFPGR